MNKNQKKGGQLHAIFALCCLVILTIICFIPILILGLLKLIPHQGWQNNCTRLIDTIPPLWIGFNNTFLNHMPTKIEITGLNNLHKKSPYLVVANHQSWLDIVILQRTFNRKIPVLKFFIKDQLKWIPLLGFAWWAMGCPFMKRYSKTYLEKKPHKKGKDLALTRKAISKFKQTPGSIMNFVEGTRLTTVKHRLQQSPYQNLLKPKAGGIGYVLGMMEQRINHLLDVSIIYPQNNYSLWDFLCKRIESIKVHVRHIPVPIEFTNDKLIQDPTLQSKFKEWINDQWAEKDRLITELKA